MRLIFTAVICYLFSVCANAQISTFSQWTWVNGDSTIDQIGIYGTRGIPSSINKPGARINCRTWTDASGNFCLFGGQGYAANANLGVLNDVWKYDPASKQWTWIKGNNTVNRFGVYGTQGIASAANNPPGTTFSSGCKDSGGNFWVFGGYGYLSSNDQGYLNDLWKYDPLINQWTWVKGDHTKNVPGVYGTKGIAAPTNKPGARSNSVTWIDASGNLWLFGGLGYIPSGFQAYLNDLWKYDPGANQWTWVSGDSIYVPDGVYGTLGIPDAANKPGGRERSVAWTDAAGSFWLFGGTGPSSSGFFFNDLWKYDTATDRWTWLKGDSTADQAGIYGTKGTPAAGNKPGGRYGSTSWVDAAGNFWLLGGGYDYDCLNDLWKYDPVSNQWTWISGDTIINQIGVYNIEGTPPAILKPGARLHGAAWKDFSGNLWLFGGGGYATTTSQGGLNDLWKLSKVSSPTNYFRSITSGNWNAPSTWESAADTNFTTGLANPATLAPDYKASAITIRNAHTITITDNLTIAKTTVNTGSALIVSTGVIVTVQ